jgi:hypothetical protein
MVNAVEEFFPAYSEESYETQKYGVWSKYRLLDTTDGNTLGSAVP